MRWMKDGKFIDHTDAILKIEAVKKEDKGSYQCVIKNDQESAQATAELKLGGRCKFKFFIPKTKLYIVPLIFYSRSTNNSSSFLRRNSPTWQSRFYQMYRWWKSNTRNFLGT